MIPYKVFKNVVRCRVQYVELSSEDDRIINIIPTIYTTSVYTDNGKHFFIKIDVLKEVKQNKDEKEFWKQQAKAYSTKA